jgi:hypothetical protein
MPLAAVAFKLGPVLTPENLAELGADAEFMSRLATEGSLIDLAHDFAGVTDDERVYLDSMPYALREAVRVTIRAAIQEGKGVQVQFSPAYDFGLRIWDYGQAISVHLEGPYTEDTRPDRVSA